MPLPKVKNQSLSSCPLYPKHLARCNAQEAARAALTRIYDRAFYRAQVEIPHLQRRENSQYMNVMFNWNQIKKPNIEYVMIRSLVDGETKPVFLQLTSEGYLTYRQLYFQLREHLALEKKHSLRVCHDRPWYQHCTRGLFLPGCRLISADDSNCATLFGTTLLYYPYVHLTEN